MDKVMEVKVEQLQHSGDDTGDEKINPFPTYNCSKCLLLGPLLHINGVRTSIKEKEMELKLNRWTILSGDRR